MDVIWPLLNHLRTTSWMPLCDINSIFIMLILFPNMIFGHPLHYSETVMKSSDAFFLPTTPSVSDPVTTLLNGFGDVLTSNNSSLPFNAAYMARVYGRLGINYDIDAGMPFIYCEKFDPKSCAPSDPQCPTLERCYAEPQNRAQRLGCMTVFKYFAENGNQGKVEVTLKGCWQHDKEVIAECKVQDECVAETTRRQATSKMEFCCCRSHMCNKKVSVRILDEPRDGTLKHDINETITVTTMSRWMSNMWLLMLFVLIGICIAGSLLVFSLLYRRFWQSKDKIKSQTVTSTQNSETYALLNCTAARSTFEITDMKHLASGRFGDVFSAIYRSADRVAEVAVKVLKDEESWHSEQTVYIDVLRRAGHPNILRYIDVERRDNNEYWLITEFMNEGNLHDYLKKNVLTLNQCLHIMSGMLEGLAFLHEAQGSKFTVVHRDIKSKNILLKSMKNTESEKEVTVTACIADFGLAAVFSTPQINDQVTGQVGTFRYMSPEVLEGATEFTIPAFQRIDVYAMALVMWEVLSRSSLDGDDVDIPVYKQPFEDMTSPYPSLGEMRDVVVNRKLRPFFRPAITRHEVGGEIEFTIRDMWHTIADGRITASRARERINTLSGNSSQCSVRYYSSGDHNQEMLETSTTVDGGGCGALDGSVSYKSFNAVIEESGSSRDAFVQER